MGKVDGRGPLVETMLGRLERYDWHKVYKTSNPLQWTRSDERTKVLPDQVLHKDKTWVVMSETERDVILQLAAKVNMKCREYVAAKGGTLDPQIPDFLADNPTFHALSLDSCRKSISWTRRSRPSLPARSPSTMESPRSSTKSSKPHKYFP